MLFFGCLVGGVGPYMLVLSIPVQTATSSSWNKGVPAFQKDAASGGGGCFGGLFLPGFGAFSKGVHFPGEKWRFLGGGLLLVLSLE